MSQTPTSQTPTSQTLSEQLEEYRAGWMQRVPAERRAMMERHIAHLAETGFGKRGKQVGDRAPAIVLPDAHGKSFDVTSLLAKGPVVVTFYPAAGALTAILNSRPISRCCRASPRPVRAWSPSVPRSRTIRSPPPRRTH